MKALTNNQTAIKYEKDLRICIFCQEYENIWLFNFNKPVCSLKHYARVNWKIFLIPTIFFSILSYYLRSSEISGTLPLIIAIIFIVFVFYGRNIDNYEKSIELRQGLFDNNDLENNRAFKNFIMSLKSD